MRLVGEIQMKTVVVYESMFGNTRQSPKRSPRGWVELARWRSGVSMTCPQTRWATPG
jgi:hypothetical protein